MKPKYHIRHLNSLVTAFSSAICFCMTLGVAHAASLTWDGNGAVVPNPNGGAGTWDVNTSANWWNGTTNVTWPIPGGTDDDAVFADTAGAVTIAAGGVTANDLTFSTSGYTVGGGILTLNTTGVVYPKLTTDPGVTATISSAIAGTNGLIKLGDGTLVLSGTNTYTGTTALTAGKLSVGLDANLGNANPLYLNGGTLQITGLVLNSYAAGLIGTHAVTTTAGQPIGFDIANAANNFNVSTVMNQGSGGLTKEGAGTLTLSAANTFSGLTTVSAGTLAYGIADALGAGAVTVNGAGAVLALGAHSDTVGTVTLTNGSITGAGGVLTSTGSFEMQNGSVSAILGGAGIALNKTTVGTVTLSGVNTYTGVTTLSGGTLSVATIGNGGVAGNLGAASNAAANLVFDGGTLQYTGATASTDRAFTINAGKVAVIQVGGANNLTITGASAASDGGLSKIGTGTLTLSGLNLHTGLTTVTVGTLAYGAADALSTGAVTVDGAGALLDVGAYSDTVGTVTLANGGISGTTGVLTSTGSFEMQNGFVSAILGGTGIALNKTTAGTVTLTGVNTYTGPTTLSGGILSVATIGNGGVAGNLGAASNAAANLVFDGGTLQYTGLTASTDRSFTIAAGKVATLDVTANNLTISGASAATSGGLSKIGVGTLTLSGLNLYTGLTTVSAGTLAYGVTDALSTGDVTVSGAAAVLALGTYSDSVGTVTLANGSITGTTGVLTSTGSFEMQNGSASAILGGAGIALNKTTVGSVLLTGANTYTGATNVNAGTLTIDGASGSISASSGINLFNGGTLTLTNTTTVEGAVNRIGNAAGLTAHGGTFNYNNTSGAGLIYGETLGVLTLAGGQLNAVLVNNMGGGGGNAQMLTLGGLTRSADSAAVAFSAAGGLNTTTNMIKVTGAGTTPATGGGGVGIIGQWATVGTVFNGQTDYATYSTDHIVGANISGSAETTWIVGTENYTCTSNATLLTGNRMMNSWRYNAAAGALNLGAFNFDSNGILNGGTGLLTISGTGAVRQQGTAAGNLYVTAGNADIVISAPIQNNTGALSLVKSGSNVLTLSGVSTYTGATIVNEGILKAGVASVANVSGAFGLNSAVTLVNASGVVMDITGFNTQIGSLAGGGSLGGNVVLGAATLTVGGDNTNTNFDGVISGVGGGLDKIGTGTLTLGGLNTYTGLTKVSDGTLAYGISNVLDGGAVTVDGANAVLSLGTHSDTVGTVTLTNGSITGTTGVLTSTGSFEMQNGLVTAILDGAVALNKTTAGTVTLTGVNTYTGPTTLSGGILSVGTIGDGGVAGNLGAATNAAANLVFNGGTLQYTGADASSNRDFTINAGQAAIIDVSANNLTLAGTNNAASTGGLTKTGAGTLTLGGVNTYTGVTTFAGGVLSVATIGNGGVAGNLGAASNLATNLVFDGGTLLYTGADAITDRNFTINAGKVAVIDVTANNLTLGGTNAAPTTGGLTKIGNGILTLTLPSTYSGITTVGAGTLSISNVDQLGSNADMNLGIAATSSGTLQYTGAAGTLAKNVNVLGNGADTIQNSGSGLLTLTGTITKDGTTLVLKGGANGIEVSGTGTITGLSANSDLVIDGGVTTLATANTYNGPTSIKNGGLLNANAANALPTVNGRSAVTMTGGSQLAFNGFGQSIASLTGDATSLVHINNNTITIGNASGVTDFAGVIDGTGALLKDGASTQILSGINTYSGTTTVNGGNLVINGAIAAGAVTVNSGGTLRGTGTIGGNTTINVGGTLAVNPGQTPANGNLTFNGNLVTNGTVKMDFTSQAVHELITVKGAGGVTFGGQLVVTNTTPGTFGLAQGTSAVIFDATSGNYHGDFTGYDFSTFNSAIGFDSTNGTLYSLGAVDAGVKQTKTYQNLNENQTNTYYSLFDDSLNLGSRNVFINESSIGGYNVTFSGGFLNGNTQLIQALIGSTKTIMINGEPLAVIDEQIMNHLSPEVHRGMVDYTEQATRTHIREGVDAAPIANVGQTQVFATVHSSRAGAEANYTNASYDTEMNGATIGARYDIDSRFQVGGLIGADEGSITGNLIDTDAQGMVFGAFARYLVHEPSKTTITGSLSYGTYDYDSKRDSFESFDTRTKQTTYDSAKANGINSDAIDLSLGVRTVSFEQGGFRLIPNATVRYLTGKVDGFTEDGGNGVKLRVDEQEIDSLLLDIGIDIEYQVQEQFKLVGNVGYVTDFLDGDTSVSARFAASGADARQFSVSAPGIDDEGFVLGLGAFYDINDSSRVGVTYRCDFRKNSDISQTLGLGASFGF